MEEMLFISIYQHPVCPDIKFILIINKETVTNVTGKFGNWSAVPEQPVRLCFPEPCEAFTGLHGL